MRDGGGVTATRAIGRLALTNDHASSNESLPSAKRARAHIEFHGISPSSCVTAGAFTSRCMGHPWCLGNGKARLGWGTQLCHRILATRGHLDHGSLQHGEAHLAEGAIRAPQARCQSRHWHLRGFNSQRASGEVAFPCRLPRRDVHKPDTLAAKAYRSEIRIGVHVDILALRIGGHSGNLKPPTTIVRYTRNVDHVGICHWCLEWASRTHRRCGVRAASTKHESSNRSDKTPIEQQLAQTNGIAQIHARSAL